MFALLLASLLVFTGGCVTATKSNSGAVDRCEKQREELRKILGYKDIPNLKLPKSELPVVLKLYENLPSPSQEEVDKTQARFKRNGNIIEYYASLNACTVRFDYFRALISVGPNESERAAISRAALADVQKPRHPILISAMVNEAILTEGHDVMLWELTNVELETLKKGREKAHEFVERFRASKVAQKLETLDLPVDRFSVEDRREIRKLLSEEIELSKAIFKTVADIVGRIKK